MANPVNLPEEIRYVGCQFTSKTMRDVSRMQGRRVEVAEFGTPWWQASYTTQLLNRRQSAQISAWLMEQSTAGAMFLAYHTSHPRPVNHNSGQRLSGVKALGGPFDGAANLVSITNSRQVVVDGLPADFTLDAGDYIEFKKTALTRSLHMITESATADVTGRVELTFRHGLDRQHFTIRSDVQFEKPACVMQLTKMPPTPKGAAHSSITFDAQEVFFQ